jgi:hypothetical protein
MNWLAGRRIYLLLGAVGLLVYGATAGSRLRRQSPDPHFVLLADALLRGRLHIEPPAGADTPVGDDWAKLETVELTDGRQVRGRRLHSRPTFRIAGGGEVPVTQVARHLETAHYVSFPPFPALLMVPQVLVHGDIANDVATTVLIAALVLPLGFAVLRRLHRAGLSQRSPGDDLWLVALLGFGSVFYFSAVQGRVWFTAHVVGVALTLGYMLCAIEARRPLLAGLLLGLAAITRTPLAFMFPLFIAEALRLHRRDRRALGRVLAGFAAPVLAIAVATMAYNTVRFAEPFEFGHSYLAVIQQRQMESHGMFSYTYLARNLAVALTLLPRFTAAAPHLQISGHGLALWLTTPLLWFLPWPRRREAPHAALWLTAAAVAIPSLFYQNSGWQQFGYRFSLDYLPFLVALLAIGGRPLTTPARGLIVAGIAINLFGAVTFGRHHRFYDMNNRGACSAYSCIVPH